MIQKFVIKQNLIIVQKSETDMSTKQIDRRIQKTRQILLEALISLILEKGYEAITVQNIIDRANVGRSTFYSHFENKEHLLLAGYSSFKQLIEEGIATDEKSTTQPGINFLALYQHVSGNLRLARAILGKKSGDLLAAHLKYILAEKVLQYLSQTGQKDDMMMNLVADASGAAMVSLMMSWIEMETPFSTGIMAEKSQTLLTNLLR